MTIKVFETIRGAATGPMVASESMGTHLFSARKKSKIFENPKIDQNPVYARTAENQGTLGPSFALECKCAFGAKNLKGEHNTVLES